MFSLLENLFLRKVPSAILKKMIESDQRLPQQQQRQIQAIEQQQKLLQTLPLTKILTWENLVESLSEPNSAIPLPNLVRHQSSEEADHRYLRVYLQSINRRFLSTEAFILRQPNDAADKSSQIEMYHWLLDNNEIEPGWEKVEFSGNLEDVRATIKDRLSYRPPVKIIRVAE